MIHDSWRKAIFLDRDGVLIALSKGNEAYGFIYKKEDIEILPGVKDALRALKEKGYLLCVITNQPTVARGLATYEEVESLHKFINAELGGVIDKFYFCPHHPEMHPDVPERARKYRVACECRKPLPGMLHEAALDFGIDLTKSWMIGDMITDIAAGAPARCRTILIESAANKRTTISHKPFDPKNISPDYVVKNLTEATKYII